MCRCECAGLLCVSCVRFLPVTACTTVPERTNVAYNIIIYLNFNIFTYIIISISCASEVALPCALCCSAFRCKSVTASPCVPCSHVRHLNQLNTCLICALTYQFLCGQMCDVCIKSSREQAIASVCPTAYVCAIAAMHAV